MFCFHHEIFCIQNKKKFQRSIYLKVNLLGPIKDIKIVNFEKNIFLRSTHNGEHIFRIQKKISENQIF